MVLEELPPWATDQPDAAMTLSGVEEGSGEVDDDDAAMTLSGVEEGSGEVDEDATTVSDALEEGLREVDDDAALSGVLQTEAAGHRPRQIDIPGVGTLAVYEVEDPTDMDG